MKQDHSPNRLRATKFQAIQRELQEFKIKAWRERREESLYQIRPRPVQDKDTTSRSGGPQMRTLQWGRE